MPFGHDPPAERVERVFQFSLLLLVTSGYLAILTTGETDLISATLVGAALIARFLSAARFVRVTIPTSWASVAAAVVMIAYALEIYFPSQGSLERFVPATIRLMLLFTALKLVTADKGRDYFYLGVLAFLQLLTASMFLVEMTYLALLVIFLLLMTTSYAAFEVKRGCEARVRVVEDADPKGRRELGSRLVLLTSGVAAGVLVVSTGLFFVLPRTPGTSAFPGLAADYSIAFSREVNLGATGAVQADHTPVMRIESLSGDDLSGLLWRGLALWQFDGVRWSSPSSEVLPVDQRTGIFPFSDDRRRPAPGRRIRYAVNLEPLPADNLFLAGVPERIRIPVPTLLLSDTGSFLVKEHRPKPFRYEVESWVAARGPRKPHNAVELFSRPFSEKYLKLPEIDPRVAGLARQITRGQLDPLGQAEALEYYLRNEFGYTINLPLERSRDPLANFLFDRREGHCEYFASAMVVMLRTLNIPSRMVAGFAGGVFNPISDLQIVRSSDAHTWVEAYLPRYGWLSYDPTPRSPDDLTASWYGQYWMYWDALRSSWSEWVVDYDATHQLMLARAVREASRRNAIHLLSAVERAVAWAESTWQEAKLTMAGPFAESAPWWAFVPAFLMLPLIAVVGWRWARSRLVLAYRSRRLASGLGSTEDCSFLYRQAMAMLKRRGFTRKAWQTAEEFTASIPPPELRNQVKELTAAYNAARFGRDGEAERRLPTLVQALEKKG